MEIKNTKGLTQPERAFWRDAFLAAEVSTLIRKRHLTPQEVAHAAADYADAAVIKYRERVLWRGK
jgi:phage gp46-like protein